MNDHAHADDTAGVLTHGDDDWPDEPDLPGAPEPEPLPLHALPWALRLHVESVAGATQTPADMALMLALASVSAAVRGAAEIDIGACGWRELITIYTAIVSEPATRKSAAYAHMTALLRTWEARAIEDTGRTYRAALDRVDVARAALKHARTQLAKDNGSISEVKSARRARRMRNGRSMSRRALFLLSSTENTYSKVSKVDRSALTWDF